MDDHAACTQSLEEQNRALRARLAFFEHTTSYANGASPKPSDTLAQRYRVLAEAMPQLVWTANACGEHVYFNRRWYAYTGLSEADSLGFGFAHALHPDDRERTLEQWQLAWQAGASYEIEYRFRRYDGVYRWFVGRALPIQDASGAFVEWVGTCTDINDQKRNEVVQTFLAEASHLLSSSLDYKAILAHIAELAVPRIADWCAVDMRERAGGVRRVAVAHIDPQKIARAHKLQQLVPFDPNAPRGLAAVLRTGKSDLFAEIPEQLIRQSISDPEVLDLALSLDLRSSMIVPLIVGGRTLGAITFVSSEVGRRFGSEDLGLAEELARRAASAIDNAELYRELNEFKTTLDSTSDCVFTCDPETLIFSYVNQGAVDQVGYSRAELLTMTPLDLKPRFDEASYRAMLAPLLKGESASYTFQTVHRHKDGHELPVEVTIQYVAPPDEQGRFVAIVRDISERKRVEQQLRERAIELSRITRALETRNRELDHFAYVTSHDLKAPLRGIANLAQWIEEDLGEHATADIQRQLNLLTGRVLRMEALIDGILQYSRVGRVKNAVECVHVATLLNEIIDLQALPPGFSVRVGEGMPTFETQRVPLQQVFTNLLSNAIKHHDRATGTIAIDVADADTMYAFSVTDDGPGIAPQYYERIFVIFQTLASRDKVEGSGLGLSLVKKIVETQGGTITVESGKDDLTNGRGTTFCFTWPKLPLE